MLRIKCVPAFFGVGLFSIPLYVMFCFSSGSKKTTTGYTIFTFYTPPSLDRRWEVKRTHVLRWHSTTETYPFRIELFHILVSFASRHLVGQRKPYARIDNSLTQWQENESENDLLLEVSSQEEGLPVESEGVMGCFSSYRLLDFSFMLFRRNNNKTPNLEPCPGVVLVDHSHSPLAGVCILRLVFIFVPAADAKR